MSTRPGSAATTWLWSAIALPTPRVTRTVVSNPQGHITRWLPLEARPLPVGWTFIPGATPFDGRALAGSFNTGSALGALTWYDQPLTFGW